MWYVYILESSIDLNHYIGSTNDLERRLLEHNSGKGEATKPRRALSSSKKTLMAGHYASIDYL